MPACNVVAIAQEASCREGKIQAEGLLLAYTGSYFHEASKAACSAADRSSTYKPEGHGPYKGRWQLRKIAQCMLPGGMAGTFTIMTR